MNHLVVGLFSPSLDASIAPYGGRYTGMRAKYRRLIWYTAAPRPEDYMRDLFHDAMSDGVFVRIDPEGQWKRRAASADVVVLLYPDAIGLGYLPVERQIARVRKAWAAVRVLNGRRRGFLLTPSVLAGLWLRRMLSRLLVGELVFTVFFVLITPIFLLLDLLRERP